MNRKIQPPEQEGIAALVQPDRVHRRVYTDPEIFELEMEKIWGRAWLFIGHESQVPGPGDYYTTMAAKQPVIMIRHRDNSIHVLYNRCAHKGARVIAGEYGHCEQLRCCYHGWVYDTDGTLLHVPRAEGYQNTGFDCKHPMARLLPLPRVDSYRGFVFVNLDRDAEDLKSWLGPAAASFDNALDRSPTGEIEVCGGVLRYVHDANWKILLENVSDNMHPAVTHQSLWQPVRQLAAGYHEDELPELLVMLQPFGGSYDFFDEVAMTVCGNGHSWTGGDVSIHSTVAEQDDYIGALAAVHGEEETRKILAQSRQNTIIYPSVVFKSALQVIRVYRPLSVDRTIQETWTYRLKGAPDELLQRSVLYNQLIFSPSSIAGQDDWEAYHRVQQGLTTRAADWVSQHRHMGREQQGGNGCATAAGTSDIVFRHEFQAWCAYMSA